MRGAFAGNEVLNKGDITPSILSIKIDLMEESSECNYYIISLRAIIKVVVVVESESESKSKSKREGVHAEREKTRERERGTERDRARARRRKGGRTGKRKRDSGRKRK